MKKLINYIKELRKKPYGKAAIFFGFYLIFFIILFILLGTSGKSNTNQYINNNVNLSNILDKEYTFTYKVNIGDKLYLYNGTKSNDSLSFTYNDHEYMKNLDKYYIKNEDWTETENVLKYEEFLNEENLNNLIENAYYESKTTYDSGKLIYSYLISSNSINKIISNIDTDIDEIPNRIKVSIDNNIVIEIDIDLNSYCISIDDCDKNLHINVVYDE